jgi:hypothetical protein
LELVEQQGGSEKYLSQLSIASPLLPNNINSMGTCAAGHVVYLPGAKCPINAYLTLYDSYISTNDDLKYQKLCL